MIDGYIDEIQRIRDEGAIVLIKWDGARTQLRQTVVVTRDDTPRWRKIPLTKLPSLPYTMKPNCHTRVFCVVLRN
jgi:hypothetical protein